MSDCLFYGVHQHQMASRENRGDQQSAGGATVKVPHCTHAASPARLRQVLSVIGGARLLRCGGHLAQCQVPLDKR